MSYVSGVTTDGHHDLLGLATSDALDWQLADVAAAKISQGLTVTVLLPALNEEATVGAIVTQIRRELMADSDHRLVDELIVVNSGSTDRTRQVALDAGAEVLEREDVLSSIPVVVGKGEALWRGLAGSSGDLVVFIDADLRSFSTGYVVSLLGPLLQDPLVQLVKAVYERPLVGDRQTTPAGGGRVTELVARPLLNLHWPELAGVIQPLAGEYAGRRELLEQLPFATGYGVDFALLIDTFERFGLAALAQVDLGVRVHRHHDTARLGRMAAQIMQTAWNRLPSAHPHQVLGDSLVQFEVSASGYQAARFDVAQIERPPLAQLAESSG